MRVEPGNPDATVLVELVVAVDTPVDGPGLTRDAEVGANHTAVPDQQGDDPLGGVARHREADTLRHGDDRRVDPDHLAAGVYQPASGISRVERAIRPDGVT